MPIIEKPAVGDVNKIPNRTMPGTDPGARHRSPALSQRGGHLQVHEDVTKTAESAATGKFYGRDQGDLLLKISNHCRQ
jgi:hypothetical protein